MGRTPKGCGVSFEEDDHVVSMEKVILPPPFSGE